MLDGGEERGSLNVLVAEDNSFNQAVARSTLERHGHRVTLASNGREAVDLTALTLFDVVLMDVQMPQMDGLAATSCIRRRERGTGRRVPIIAMTALEGSGDAEACRAAGMDGVLAKPLSMTRLREVLEDVTAASIAAPESGLHDRAALLALAGDDLALLARLVDLFAEQAAGLMRGLAQGLARGDGPAVNQAAHALKSTLGHWGQGRAYGLAARLERLGRDGCLADAPWVYDELRDDMKTLEARLRAMLGPERSPGT